MFDHNFDPNEIQRSRGMRVSPTQKFELRFLTPAQSLVQENLRNEDIHDQIREARKYGYR